MLWVILTTHLTSSHPPLQTTSSGRPSMYHQSNTSPVFGYPAQEVGALGPRRHPGYSTDQPDLREAHWPAMLPQSSKSNGPVSLPNSSGSSMRYPTLTPMSTHQLLGAKNHQLHRMPLDLRQRRSSHTVGQGPYLRLYPAAIRLGDPRTGTNLMAHINFSIGLLPVPLPQASGTCLMCQPI